MMAAKSGVISVVVAVVSAVAVLGSVLAGQLFLPGNGFTVKNGAAPLPLGLFTRELEVSLLKRRADLAVHSLKDLPTELPEGLKLGAVAGCRADARDVLLYKAPLKPGLSLANLPPALTVATSSTRRKAQLLALRPDFKVVDIRGNVGTRLRKLAELPELDATILAAAGLALSLIHI